jgi:hypothetical protein
MCDGNLAMANALENDADPIEILISKYSMEIIRLKDEMKTIPASIPWGVKSGKVEAYENIIKDLECLL